MAIARGPGWLTIARILGFLALICVFLSVVVPGAPDWLLALAVVLLSAALILD